MLYVLSMNAMVCLDCVKRVVFVLIDDELRIDCMNQTCVLCNQCLTIFGMEINKLKAEWVTLIIG